MAGVGVVLFSAIAVEAFLNELSALASTYAANHPQARALADSLEDVEEGHGSIRLKLIMAAIALGSPIQKGSDPYQSFELLFRVRDTIVHMKPHRTKFTEGGVETEPKKLLGQLHSRQLISDPSALPARSFPSHIATSALCSWAVETARRVVSHVVGLLPEGDFRKHVTFLVAEVLGVPQIPDEPKAPEAQVAQEAPRAASEESRRKVGGGSSS